MGGATFQTVIFRLVWWNEIDDPSRARTDWNHVKSSGNHLCHSNLQVLPLHERMMWHQFDGDVGKSDESRLQ
jgi:hypothetical protein